MDNQHSKTIKSSMPSHADFEATHQCEKEAIARMPLVPSIQPIFTDYQNCLAVQVAMYLLPFLEMGKRTMGAFASRLSGLCPHPWHSWAVINANIWQGRGVRSGCVEASGGRGDNTTPNMLSMDKGRSLRHTDITSKRSLICALRRYKMELVQYFGEYHKEDVWY